MQEVLFRRRQTTVYERERQKGGEVSQAWVWLPLAGRLGSFSVVTKRARKILLWGARRILCMHDKNDGRSARGDHRPVYFLPEPDLPEPNGGEAQHAANV
jgi:hypothetical protein